MKLYFDTRLGYLVTAPGQDTALTGFSLKVGDTSSIDIEFGRSADPTGTPSFISGSTWTKEQLTGGSNITIGFKEDGDYADGTLLAGSSSFSYSDYVYTFSVSLNTTALNTAFSRDDADDSNDLATLATSFEVTYQPGGSGGWLSSILPVTATIYNDVLLGDESSPSNAASPDEYLLKQDGIRWLPTVTSKIGGTAADLDAIATVALDVGVHVQFVDTDGASDILRDYVLTAGTDAENSPNVIRPDDYDGSTNAKVWVLKEAAAGAGISDIVEDTTPQLGGTLDTNAKQIRWSKGADVASATTLTLGDDGNYFDITGTNTISSINAKAVGTVVRLQFDGILTLNHSANLFLCNNAGNIITAAGDHVDLVEYASGQWRAINYQRANGKALQETAVELVDDTTPQLGGPLSANGNIVKWSKGADVASATTLTLGDDGNYFDVTGTTNISEIAGKGIGTRVLLQFDSILTINHSATDLVLLTGDNITTAAGDHAEFVEYASGDWRMVDYAKADGSALAAAATGGALQADGSVDGTGEQSLSVLSLTETGSVVRGSTTISVDGKSHVIITSGSGDINTLSGTFTTGQILHLYAQTEGAITFSSGGNVGSGLVGRAVPTLFQGGITLWWMGSAWYPFTELSEAAFVDWAFDEYNTETAATTPLTPNDDTPPTSAEGVEVLSITHSCADSGNSLLLSGVVANDTSGTRTVTIAVFDGSTLIKTFARDVATYDRLDVTAFSVKYDPGDTSAHTYTVRVGVDGGTLYLNRTNSGTVYNNTLTSNLLLQEVKP